MKKIVICMTVVMGMTILQAEAFDWTSALNMIQRTSQASATQTAPSTLDDIEKQITAIDSSVQTSFVNIVSAISGWKETRTVKSQLKSNENSLSEIISAYVSDYIGNNKQDIVNKIKKMSASEKEQLINDISNIAANGQDYFVLAANGAKAATNTFKAVQTVNDAAVTITNINKVSSEIKNRATTVMALANKLKSIATEAGVNINKK